MASPSALSGRVALVTGGGRGIGREIALELARAGADVAVNYHDEPDRARATAADIEALGVRAMAVAADVGDAAAVRRMVEEVTAAFGSLDILVNNAGVQTWTPFLDVTEVGMGSRHPHEPEGLLPLHAGGRPCDVARAVWS